MTEGMIIKGIGGFYYVKTDKGVIECRARGLFRKKKITPLVGDRVKIRILENDMTGYVEEILDRDSVLVRPAVANVNHALIVFAIKNPDPNIWLLDKFLLLAEYQGLDATICFNKIDLIDGEDIEKLKEVYQNAGYTVVCTSNKTGEGIDRLRERLKDSITVFAGPSGVGKSSLLNRVQPNLELQTGEISKKTKRGKHTTRHAEFMELNIGGWVVDTPGFSSLDLNFINEEELSHYFKEIAHFSQGCKFTGCRHDKEPDCAVKEAVRSGEISEIRYKNYLRFLEELKQKRRF